MSDQPPIQRPTPNEEALRESEERHRLISELTSDYAYMTSISAEGKFRIESATPGFSRVTGYTVEELEARGGWMVLIHPDDLATSLKKAADLLAGKRGVHEVRIVTRDGEIRWIRYSTHPIWDDKLGRVVRMLGAVQDITTRKRAEEKLQEYAQRLRALSRRLLEVQEQERRFLARELHDEFGQVLTGLKLALEMATRLPADRVGPTLSEAQALVKDLTARVRDLALRLRPAMLDDLGLLPALLWLFDWYTARMHVRVIFEHSGLERRFAPDVETAAYRIVQEAITNVARHAGVGELTVRAWTDGGELHLHIEDKGKGFDPGMVRSHGESSGLSGMYERAALLGGRLSVESVPGTGSRLTARLPVGDLDTREPDDRDSAPGG
jgi:PAS domain S-box-containing protein